MADAPSNYGGRFNNGSGHQSSATKMSDLLHSPMTGHFISGHDPHGCDGPYIDSPQQFLGHPSNMHRNFQHPGAVQVAGFYSQQPGLPFDGQGFNLNDSVASSSTLHLKITRLSTHNGQHQPSLDPNAHRGHQPQVHGCKVGAGSVSPIPKWRTIDS
jgi:hypothetical protein